MMSETNEPAGWRPKKESTGLIMDLATHEVVTRGLAMPHSPRLRDGKLFVLNSGCGRWKWSIKQPASGKWSKNSPATRAG